MALDKAQWGRSMVADCKRSGKIQPDFRGHKIHANDLGAWLESWVRCPKYGISWGSSPMYRYTLDYTVWRKGAMGAQSIPAVKRRRRGTLGTFWVYGGHSVLCPV